MKPIHICVPVLKRYDLLKDLVASLPITVSLHIIDNGCNTVRLHAALDGRVVDVFEPTIPMGVAESWNWFIDHVPEERVIVNDDVTFAPDSLARLTAPDSDLIFAQGIGFSCFVLRDSCVEKIGRFDETISPGYAYYEDEDYLQRIDGKGTRPPTAGVRLVDVDCGATHLKSSTLAMLTTPEEQNEHHRKFWIAQTNYINKWHLERVFNR